MFDKSDHRKSEKRYKNKLRTSGLCSNCGQTPCEEGKFKCTACLAINAAFTSSRRKACLEKGNCVGCHHKKQLPNVKTKYCETCWFKNAARSNGFATENWADLKAILESQNFICPYTGSKLKIGVNASIDHKNPRSRFPEQADDLSNIEWISLKVNFIKRDLTKPEFIELCKTIVQRCKNF